MHMRGTSVHATLDDPMDEEWSMRADRSAGAASRMMPDMRGFWMILRWRAGLIAAITVATVFAAAMACLTPVSYTHLTLPTILRV